MASLIVDKLLQEALDDFQAALTVDQRKRLRELETVPDFNAVIKFTTELDAQNAQRRSPSVASRISKVLESVQQFAQIVDTFVSSNPSIAALVWGSVKLTMLVSAPDLSLMMCSQNVPQRRCSFPS